MRDELCAVGSDDGVKAASSRRTPNGLGIGAVV